MKRQKNKKLILRLTAVFLALLFWQALSSIVKEEMIVPSIFSVLKRALSLMREEEFIAIICFSIYRVFLGIIFGTLIGLLLGIIAGKYKTAEVILEPYFVTAKAVPVASFVIILLMWLSSSELPIFIAGLIVVPMIYTNTLTGIRQTDKKLLEMAAVFKLSLLKKIKFIYIPGLAQYFISALKISVSNAWKAGIAAEIIGLPDGSIGNEIYKAKIYFETADMFAWTIFIVFFSFIFEKLFIGFVGILLRRVGCR